MAVLDFFKKKPQDDGASSNVGVPQAPPVTPMPPTPTVVQETQTVMSAPGGGSFNGIGNPPGGQSFNGIGTPSAPAPTVAMPDAPVAAMQPVQPQAPVSPATPAQPVDPNAPVPPTADPAAIPVDPNAAPTDTNAAPADATKSPEQDKQMQLDLMTHLTQRSNRVFVTAQQKAKELASEFVDSEHVLHGLLADSEIYKMFTEVKVQPQIIEQELDKAYQKGTSQNQPTPSPRVKRILENALVTARKLGYEFISPEHILLALNDEGEGIGSRILAKLGVKKEDLNKKVTGKKEGLEEGKPGESSEKNQSTLAQYTKDLTLQAEQGQLDPVVERSEVIERAIHIISRRTKNNPVLVGEAGVGKTAVVEGLAQKIASKEVPESLIGKRILQLDLMSIIAGASHRGEFEERMKKIIEEIVASNNQVILFIDEIHNLVGAGAGGEGSLDASNFLKPALARGELQMIGATTLTEYRKYIEKDPALERRFQPVLTPEPTPEQAIKMLKALKGKYEAFHRVEIPDAAIDVAVNLSKRYVGDRFLPDKAIDLIDEACAAVRLPLISLPEEIRSVEERIKQFTQELDEVEKRGDKVKASILRPKLDDLTADLKEKQEEYNMRKGQTTTSVNEQTIKDIISRWTGIPISKISESETEKLTKLEDIIHERLINQTHAVEPVAQAIRRGRAGLKSTDRPIGSFVFLGPTGVGKTELSKTLAEVLFGQEEAMIRFDMTEYMEKHEVAKLLGAPPGYVGYEEGGKLTEAVRRKPYSVVLFDEIEKAHPDIFNILLQVLDDGRLTDNKGHVVSFKNAVVICTSNIGTKLIQDDILAGKQAGSIEEPTVITTYAFSPRGRQIMTIMGKVFQRENATTPWAISMMLDYFAGQKIEKIAALPAPVVEGEEPTEAPKGEASDMNFPVKQFDTHAMSPQGVEMITEGENVLIRTSTTAKVWNGESLIEYFKEGVVINALPDAPEQQLPTARLKTHTFSPTEDEIVTFGDRFWRKKGAQNNWETGTLKDYFDGQTLEEGKVDAAPKAADATIPADKAVDSAKPVDGAPVDPTAAPVNQVANVPLADSKPMQAQSQAAGLDDAKPVDASKPATDPAKPADPTKPVTPSSSPVDKLTSSPITLPTNYWDIHAFTGEGDEIIIVSDRIWVRKTQTTVWKSMLLLEFFGKDFPLEKEIEEKQKIEDELATNQYEKTKSKVMDELRKFFRPELINRFDEVIIFEPLKYKHMMKIAELQMKGIRKLLEDQNMGFAWTDSAKKELVRSGFDPIYGARPLKRTIQKLIENPISTLIIEKKVDESDMILVDFDGDKFIFNVEHVSFVKEEKAKKVMKKYTCNQNHQFETEVVKNATVICPKEPKDIVREVIADKKDGVNEPNGNKGQQSAKPEDQKPPQGGPQGGQQNKGPQNNPQQNQNKPSNNNQQPRPQGNGQQNWNTKNPQDAKPNGGNTNSGSGIKGNTYVLPNAVNKLPNAPAMNGAPQNIGAQSTQQFNGMPSQAAPAPTTPSMPPMPSQAAPILPPMPTAPTMPPSNPLPTDTNSGQQMQPVQN